MTDQNKTGPKKGGDKALTRRSFVKGAVGGASALLLGAGRGSAIGSNATAGGGDKPTSGQSRPSVVNSPQRYINTLWFTSLDDLALLRKAVARTKERGFDTVSLDLPWSRIETRPGKYDFGWMDQRVETVAESGLGLQFRLNTGYSKPAWIEDAFGKDIYAAQSPDDHWKREIFLRLTYARPDLVRAQADFYGACAGHFAALNREGRVMDFSAATDNAMESEYKYLDVCPAAQSQFRTWLKGEYGSPKRMAAKWGRPVGGWEDVSLETAHPTDVTRYRTWALKELFRAGARAVHDADARARFGVQFGSVWDGMSGRRCSYSVSEMLDGVDWLHVADAPNYDHIFSMDYTIGMAQGARVSNEGSFLHFRENKTTAKASHHGHSPTRQEVDGWNVPWAEETFARGADAYFLCNWQQQFLNGDLDGWAFFERNAEAARKPRSKRRVAKALFVSSWDQFHMEGMDSSHKLRGQYDRLTESRSKPIDIVSEGVFLGHPERWTKYPEGVYFSKFSRRLSDAFVKELARAGVPLHAESPDIGQFDPYGKDRGNDWRPSNLKIES